MWSRALTIAASVLLLVAVVAGYARIALVDSGQFANRATAALTDDSVRTLIAEKVTDEVVLAQRADLLAARPLIESVASGVVGSRAFADLFRAAVRDVHRAVFQRDQDTVTLTIADVGTVLAAALEQVRPSLAKEVRSTERVEVLRRDLGSTGGELARAGKTVRALALVLLLAWVALVAAAIATARDRRRAVVRLGTGAAAGGVVLVVACGIGRSVAEGAVDGPDARAAAGAVWDAFAGDLGTAALAAGRLRSGGGRVRRVADRADGARRAAAPRVRPHCHRAGAARAARAARRRARRRRPGRAAGARLRCCGCCSRSRARC